MISLSKFKKSSTNEISIISKLLKEEFSDFILTPILDVGAGTGAIANNAFFYDAAVLLDNKDNFGDTPCSPYHERIITDFFEYTKKVPIRFGTLLFSHSLQYLDYDLLKLNEAIASTNAHFIVEVTNINEGLYLQSLNFCRNTYSSCNPESEKLEFFSYEIVKEVQFSSSIYAENFKDLAFIIGRHIFDIKSKNFDPLELFLSKELKHPQMNISQVIRSWRIYEN